METFAAIFGVFCARILAYCAPVIVEILREASKDTSEDGARRDDLRERLLARLRDKNSLCPTGRASETAGINTKREGVDSRQK